MLEINKSQKPRGLVIFDAEGTLFNSEESIFQLWKYIGVVFEKETFLSLEHYKNIHLRYGSDWNSFAISEFGFKEKDFPKIMEIWKENIVDYYKLYNKFYDGIIELLLELKEQNYKIAIATNNCSDAFKDILHCNNFKEVPMYDEITHIGYLKPDPSMIIDHIIDSGINKTETWMVGDTMFDIDAGINAGIKTVYADFHLSGNAEISNNADYTITNPSELLGLL